MSITIELSAPEIAALKQVTRRDDDAEAVMQAAREYLRLSLLHELKTASGNVEFDLHLQELEDLELNEPVLNCFRPEPSSKQHEAYLP